MLVLFETPAGYALFKLLDEGKLRETNNVWEEFRSVESAQKLVALKGFHKFANTTEALAAAAALVESKLGKDLKNFLKKWVVKKASGETLAVADPKLGGLIKDKLGIQCVHNAAVNELMRGIRTQINNLISGVGETDMNAMVLGLSHSLCRYKLKFSPDKVDVMIVQAIALLDDLDKELNTYAMRVKEWYGWHFPELVKIISDNMAYAKTVMAIGMRSRAAAADLSKILPEEIEAQVKEAAKLSMGTEISEEDLSNILELCQQVLDIHDYREQLYDYLKNRMQAIAPNLSVMVGELVGARLIAHAGSLLSLAKYPASTVQILGAEKALFRALKTKHSTPKYGLIYHASLVGQAPPKDKGKISRLVASRSALAIRVDALGENVSNQIGLEGYAKVESRMRLLEGGTAHAISGKGKAKAPAKYDPKRSAQSPGQPRTTSTYNAAADSTMVTETMSGKKRKMEDVKQETKKQEPEKNGAPEETTGKKKKKKQKKQKTEAPAVPASAATPAAPTPAATATTPAAPAPADAGKKKKKPKQQQQQQASQPQQTTKQTNTDGAPAEKNKKKKKKSKSKKE
jgi:nucleolar protein 58